MRVAIIGSRSVTLEIPEVLPFIPLGAHEIVSGGAVGADRVAELVASRLGVSIKIFRPEYAQFGRRAPLVRNEDIVRYADYVIALWDGSSRGTANAVDLCIKLYKPVRVLLCRDGHLTETMFGYEDHLL